jgi:hypothetical protein
VSNQARNAVVNLTGAMTAARNVVVPTANKVYLIKNSTTGGFVVTVKTAAGTGVEVAANTARWVYCDGTNVVDGLPGFGYGYATTATAAGTTTLTYGSARNQFFTGSTTQTVTLPVASTMTLGAQFLITNNSTGSLTVNSSGGNLVQTITAGTSALITNILTSGTSAASWSSTLYSPLSLTSTLAITGSSAGFVAFAGVYPRRRAPRRARSTDLYRNSASAGGQRRAGAGAVLAASDSAAYDAGIRLDRGGDRLATVDQRVGSWRAMDFYAFARRLADTRIMSVGADITANTPTGCIEGYTPRRPRRRARPR